MRYLKLSLLIILSALVYFVVVNFNSEESKSKLEYPGEWMYNQRAYPHGKIDAKEMRKAHAKHHLARKASKQSSLLTWDFEGPYNTGGRITDVAISPENDDHLYISSSVGGVFKSLDKGLSWDPIFDNIGRPSIGNIEIAPSNASIIYVGTGEANASASSGAFVGDGLYKSVDAGLTWDLVGLENSEHISRICIDPNNEDRVFVATTGTLYGKNEERGVYRTLNAGQNWERVLFVSDSTALIDLVINTNNSDTLFASAWERIRYPWQRSYAGPTSGVYRSVDGGDTWDLLTNGLPESSSEVGRIGLAISESDPNNIYASYTTDPITNVFDGIYQSKDGGDSWNLLPSDQLSYVNATFGWFFGNVRVNPHDNKDVWVLGKDLYKTTNEGEDWSEVYGMHVDHHAMEFSRNNSNFILAGNDGGAYLSEDGGLSWAHFENLPITQFYHIEIDEQNPERIYGGTQDNNTIRTLSGADDDWHPILGGDGFHVIVHPENSDLIFAEYQWGNLYFSYDGGEYFDEYLYGVDYNDRTNWNTPVVLSPFDNNQLYYGSNRLYSSEVYSYNWTPISGDLTQGQHPSGSLAYGVLTTIAPSYLNSNTIYTGSDDAKAQVTFDGGLTWNDISEGLPNRYITKIVVHPENDSIAYITFSGYRYLDFESHIFKTEDSGQSWIDISSNLPEMPVNDVLISTVNHILYIATDAGVWYSDNDGASWSVLGANLPITICSNLEIHEPTKRLYIGTFGRSIYSMDISDFYLDVEEAMLKDDFKLYPNPTNGLLSIDFPRLLNEDCQIELFDQKGSLVETLYSGEISNKLMNIDISNNTPGFYYVSIVAGSYKSSQEVVLLAD